MNNFSGNIVSATLPGDFVAPRDIREVPGQAGIPLLRQYWRIAVRRKWIIAGVISTALVLGLIATLLMTPLYTATATIEISRQRENIVNIEDVEADARPSAGDAELFYQTQYSLLQARSLGARVASDLGLAQSDQFFETFGVDPDSEGLFAGSGDGTLSARERAERQELAVDILLDNIAISPLRGSSLVDVSFTSPDPQLSMRIVNAWTEHFIGSNLDRRFEATSYARKFLEDRLEQLRQRLEASERRLVTYAAQQGIINVASEERGAGGDVVRERSLLSDELMALSRELASATADRIRAQALVNGEPSTSARALNNSAISGLRQTRAEVAAEYSKMQARFEPEYPPLQALAQQLEALDESIEREEARVGESVGNDYRDALQRENALVRQVEDLKAQMLDLRRRNIQYNIFQRDVDTNRELYDGLLQRYKEVGIAGGVGTNNVSVVDQAILPEEPSSPNIVLNLFIALLAGCALAGAIVFALEQIDEAIKDPSDVTRSLGAPVLGVIPASDERPIELLKDRKSDLAEAYLSLQTSLQFSTDHGLPRALAVTSTRASEGKSTTSYAIAQSLARTQRSVVLVDGDMRSPSIAQFVGLPNKFGVSNYLSGDDNIDALIMKSGDLDFAVVAAGPNPPNAAELLTGSRFKALLDELLKRFDHVVVDSPPVLGLADAPLIASRAEGVVYAVESGGARSSVIRSALGRLAAANANVLGVVLTKFEAKQAGYGYGYDYGYGYGRERTGEAG